MTRAALSGVVLAAGLSTRMGALKQLLPLDGVPAVVRAVRSFTDIGVTPVVVLGHAADEVAGALRHTDATTIVNDGFRQGMWSSVVCGLQATRDVADSVAVLPADCPLVRGETIGSLARSAASTSRPVVYPVHDGHRGHPPLLHHDIVADVVGARPSGGLREVLDRYEDDALDVTVADQGVLLDMDVGGDYDRSRRLVRAERVPDEAECDTLYDRYNVGEDVRRHCRQVAEVATAVARGLDAAGACLNEPLVRVAGLLHDVARGHSDHAAVGAAWLVEDGYPRVATVIAGHMDLVDPLPPIPGERHVLYLADKLVAGDIVVGLEQRLTAALARYEGDQAAMSAARRRIETANRIAEAVERITGWQPTDLIVRSGGTHARRPE